MSNTTGNNVSGLLPDGSAASETLIQTAVNTNTGGTIYLQDGSHWPSGFAVTPNAALPMRWIAEGSFDLGQWSEPGGWPIGPAQSWGNPPPGIGDGDQLWQYNNGSTVITHAYKANPNNQPTMVFNYINDRITGVKAANGNSECLVINGYVRSGAVGNVYPLQININSSGMGGYGVDDVPISTYCGQTGTNCGWGGVFLMADVSGLGTNRPTKKWGTETDMQGSGPEQNGYWYNPYTGGRNGALLAVAHWHGGNSWAANTAYGVGAIIQNVVVMGTTGTEVTWNSPVVDASGNPTLTKTPLPEYYNAVCTTAGTSGATIPVFPLGTGTSPHLNADGSQVYIDDGTAVWQLTVTMRAEYAQGHLVTTDTTSSIARAYDTYAIIDDCVFNAWSARMNHPQGKGAAMRCAPNQPIDWNAGMVNWGPRQNTRTTMYNATSGGFEYAVNGTVALRLLDNLTAKFAAGIGAFGVTPPTTRPSITGSRSADATSVITQLLTALSAAGLVKDGTTA